MALPLATTYGAIGGALGGGSPAASTASAAAPRPIQPKKPAGVSMLDPSRLAGGANYRPPTATGGVLNAIEQFGNTVSRVGAPLQRADTTPRPATPGVTPQLTPQQRTAAGTMSTMATTMAARPITPRYAPSSAISGTGRVADGMLHPYRQGLDPSNPGVLRALQELGVSSLDDPRIQNSGALSHIRARAGIKAGDPAAGGHPAAITAANRLEQLRSRNADGIIKGPSGIVRPVGYDIRNNPNAVAMREAAAPRAGAGGALDQPRPSGGGTTGARPIRPAGSAGGGLAALNATPNPNAAPAAAAAAGGPPGQGGSLRDLIDRELRGTLDAGGENDRRSAAYRSKLDADFDVLDQENQVAQRELAQRTSALGRKGLGNVNTQFGDLELAHRMRRDQLVSDANLSMVREDVEDYYRALGMTQEEAAARAQEDLAREGFQTSRDVANIGARASMYGADKGLEGVRLREAGETSRHGATLGFQRERGLAEDRFNLAGLEESARRFDTGVDLQNRDHEYNLSRDPIEDDFRRASLLAAYGYGGRPDNAWNTYIDTRIGGAGSYGQAATSAAQGAGEVAGSLALLDALRPGGAAATAPYNPRPIQPRGNRTQSQGR